MQHRAFFLGATLSATLTLSLCAAAPAVARHFGRDMIAVDRAGLLSELEALASEADQLARKARARDGRGLVRAAEALTGHVGSLADYVARAESARPDSDESGRRPGRRPVGSNRGAMSDQDFTTLTSIVKRASFSSDQLLLLREASLHGWFSASQVAALVELLAYGSDQVEAAAALWPRMLDPQNGVLVYDRLHYASDKQALARRLGR